MFPGIRFTVDQAANLFCHMSLIEHVCSWDQVPCQSPIKGTLWSWWNFQQPDDWPLTLICTNIWSTRLVLQPCSAHPLIGLDDQSVAYLSKFHWVISLHDFENISLLQNWINRGALEWPRRRALTEVVIFLLIEAVKQTALAKWINRGGCPIYRGG